LFNTEVEKCGEKMQRHHCHEVCHKYRTNSTTCRFEFPHDIVPNSYFDSDTNSLFLKCLDPMINYYNPYILIYCRHNHDLCCILSGKAAKAGMFYITDYITKMEMKTYQLLSLLSRAVLRAKEVASSSIAGSAKTLLHKCLSQFIKQQQIHAQQAARYICGLNDTIKSHKTLPMLSSLLLDFVCRAFPDNTVESDYYDTVLDDKEDDTTNSNSNSEDSNNDTYHNFTEPVRLQIYTDNAGKFIKANQIDHYIYRDRKLKDICFSDFIWKFKLTKKTDVAVKDAEKMRLGTYPRYELQYPHPQCQTHVLVEHTTKIGKDNTNLCIPRVIGMSIPRCNSPQYNLFMLAHFKPFSKESPLWDKQLGVNEAFKHFHFSTAAQKTMHNWEAIHECEDERDAERLRKQTACLQESSTLTNSLISNNIDDGSIIFHDVDMSVKRNLKKDLEINTTLFKLASSNWFQPPEENHTCSTSMSPLPDITQDKFTQWKSEIKHQEEVLQKNKKSLQHPESQSALSLPPNDTQDFPSENNSNKNTSPFTESGNATKQETATSLLDRIIKETNLNRKQALAFRIIAGTFINRVEKNSNNTIRTPAFKNYLRMLMTGAGGTGKTYVIEAVRKVLEHYGASHKIKCFAPTASAATLVDGSTIHKGFSIKVRKHTKNEHLEQDDDYTVFINVTDRKKMRDELKDVEIVIIDEVSLLGQQLLAEIDHALRYAKNNNEYFGGVIIIFTGDFFQFPPVYQTPLYTPVNQFDRASDYELLHRLGRLAWKSITDVICLDEQQRMKEDPEYGVAVEHLRKRKCTQTDVDLFNSRLIKSAEHPEGIDMSQPPYNDAVAIVSTNLLRETINMKKATANCQNTEKLTVCAADDTIEGYTLTESAHSHLLRMDISHFTNDGALPGLLPLYEGMPVILRYKNISTELGIVNGAQGVLRKLLTYRNSSNMTCMKAAIIELPKSKIQLSDLPPKYCILEPTSWSISLSINIDPEAENSNPEKHKLHRMQAGFQPGFAVTGQSAQGKTLPVVLSFLHHGKFSAYVSASRTRTRHGLAIVQPVTLNDLNQPLPHDLLLEDQRHQAMEHNTLVTYKFIEGDIIDVPEPEYEKKNSISVGKPNFLSKTENYTKRKADNVKINDRDIKKRKLWRKILR
jgi:hypothetical protein